MPLREIDFTIRDTQDREVSIPGYEVSCDGDCCDRRLLLVVPDIHAWLARNDWSFCALDLYCYSCQRDNETWRRIEMKVPTLAEVEALPWGAREHVVDAALRSAHGLVTKFVEESARTALLRSEKVGLTYTLLKDMHASFDHALRAQLDVSGPHHWLTHIMELAQQARSIQREQHEGDAKRLDKARRVLEFYDEMKKLERKGVDPSYLIVSSSLGYMVGQVTTDVKVKTARVQVCPPGLGWADYTFSRKRRGEVWVAEWRYGSLEITPQALYDATGKDSVR